LIGQLISNFGNKKLVLTCINVDIEHIGATKKRKFSYMSMKAIKTPPKRRFFSVRLTDKEYQNLHQVSIKLDLKPSEFIRRQITELLKHEK